jgi:hypothetical protein
LEDLTNPDAEIINRATILKNGVLTPAFSYMKAYAGA